MKVVSVMNYKGGVGKTTITSNLAAHIASRGKRVLMVDIDPQTNLTFSFIDHAVWEEQYAEGKTLKNFFRPILDGSKKRIPLSSLIISLPVGGVNIDIISSHLDLIDIDTQLAANLGGGNLMNPKYSANVYLDVHNYLHDDIKTLKERYDLILIDCAPNFNIVTKNALVASNHYLVPSKMDYLSTFGVEQLNRNIKKFTEQYNEYTKNTDDKMAITPTILGVVATMVGIRDNALINANQLYRNKLKGLKFKIFDTYLRESKACYSGAPLNNVPVIFSSEKSDRTLAKVIEELRSFGDEFMKKVGI